MHSLIFDQVSFGYADEILSDVSFTCSTGWTALVGGNGAGKTTLLGLAEGTLAPSRGTIRRTHLVTLATVAQRVDEPDPAIVELAGNYEPAGLARRLHRWERPASSRSHWASYAHRS
ncbi:MAG: ABC transporter ATP-binding protein [Deltaproteobacteria bacterium]